jgi:hypothetical protein
MSDNPRDAAALAKEAARERRRDARAAVPALFVDTWATLTWRGHIRIALGEWIRDDPYYRGAYVMELEEAEKLANFILQEVKERQQKDIARAKGGEDTAEEV